LIRARLVPEYRVRIITNFETRKFEVNEDKILVEGYREIGEALKRLVDIALANDPSK